MNIDENKPLEKTINDFLGQDETTNKDEECTTKECLIKSDKSIIERVSRKVIIEDGRELLV